MTSISSINTHMGVMGYDYLELYNCYHFTSNSWIMEVLKSESYSGKRGVWLERVEGSVVVSLMGRVMVMDGLKREDKVLIAGCRSWGGWGITVSTP